MTNLIFCFNNSDDNDEDDDDAQDFSFLYKTDILLKKSRKILYLSFLTVTCTNRGDDF